MLSVTKTDRQSSEEVRKNSQTAPQRRRTRGEREPQPPGTFRFAEEEKGSETNEVCSWYGGISEDDCKAACDADFDDPDGPLSYETIWYLWAAQNGGVSDSWLDVRSRYMYLYEEDNIRFEEYLRACELDRPRYISEDELYYHLVLAVRANMERWIGSFRPRDLPTELGRILRAQNSTLDAIQKRWEALAENRQVCRQNDLPYESETYPAECDEIGQRIAWALPTPEFLERAGAFIGRDGLLLGVASGHGYLEFCIGLQSGLRVRCTDPWIEDDSSIQPPYIALGPVEELSAAGALAAYGHEATVLMLSFPPQNEDEDEGGDSWASRAVSDWRERYGGERLMLIHADTGYPLTKEYIPMPPKLELELANWTYAMAIQLKHARDGVVWALFYRAKDRLVGT